MKINMKNGEDKGGTGGSSNNKIRIAVFGQHDVGKSGMQILLLACFIVSYLTLHIDLTYGIGNRFWEVQGVYFRRHVIFMNLCEKLNTN